uniref:Putative glycosyltransferase n=1 Tax=viral metagenome TaxID=1070528 RepID=A0A6M3JQM8_9ZZZZ
MNILIASHSACHQRQLFFYQELAKHFYNTIVIGPKQWGRLGLLNSTQEGFITRGLPVANENRLATFQFLGLESTLQLQLIPKIDLFLIQEEWWSRATTSLLATANRIGAKKVLFTWENIRIPNEKEIETINQADAIICGNNDAEQIIKDSGYRGFIYQIPQVGIDTDLFFPQSTEKSYDLVFCGRPVSEKGIDIIQRATKNHNWKLLIIANQPYRDLPAQLSQAKIFVTLPQDTSYWKEQSGGYSSLEALSCGIPVITTDCGAIPQYIPRRIATILKQDKDLEQYFITAVKKLLIAGKLDAIGARGRDYVIEHYSNQVIAKQTAEALEEL